MLHLKTNDRGWKILYFFTRGDLVFGPSGSEDAPSFWKLSGELFLLILVHVVRLNLILVSFADLQLNGH